MSDELLLSFQWNFPKFIMYLFYTKEIAQRETILPGELVLWALGGAIETF